MHIADFIIDWNLHQSTEFVSPSAVMRRKVHKAKHPTVLIKCVCMDGRINLATMTKTPSGIMYPFRTMGGFFDLGFPYFSQVVHDMIEDAVGQARHVLILCTYHFSAGDNPHRGCKGMQHDIDKGRTSALRLKAQLEEVYGHTAVHPVVIGIETDTDAFIFHNGGSDVIDMRQYRGFSEGDLHELFRGFYPRMDAQVLADLLPLAVGNLQHVEEVRGRTPIEMGHLEQVICVGRGFGWLHHPNLALIVGPFTERWPQEVAGAGGIVAHNFDVWRTSGRTPEHEGVAVLCSSAFYDPLIEKRRAEQRARYFAGVAVEVLRREVPGLPFELLIGATDMTTYRLELFDRQTYAC